MKLVSYVKNNIGIFLALICRNARAGQAKIPTVIFFWRSHSWSSLETAASEKDSN
jgi:hypothetical protein